MALQVLDRPDFGTQLGQAVGTGIDGGLQALTTGFAEAKKAQRAKQEKESNLQKFAKEIKSAFPGASDSDARLIAMLSEKDPKSAIKGLEALGARQPTIEGADGQQAALFQPQKKEKTLDDKISEGDVEEQYSGLVDMYKTSSNMLTALDDPDLRLGVAYEGLRNTFPGQLNDTTAKYAGNSSHLLNLFIDNEKGRMTNMKIKVRKGDKPSLSKGKAQNEQAAQRIRENALDKIHIGLQKYGDETGIADMTPDNIKKALFQKYPLKYPTFVKEGTIIEEKGKKYRMQGGRWKKVNNG